MYGVYIYLPSAEVSGPQIDSSIRATSSSDAAAAADKKRSSSASSSQSSSTNKDKALENAITIVEARSLIEPLIGSLLNVSPVYIYKKFKRSDYHKGYECMMRIKAKKPPKEEAYKMFEGKYTGVGLSKRLAKMDACKNAMLAWDKEKGIVIGEMSFEQYIKAILRDKQRK